MGLAKATRAVDAARGQDGAPLAPPRPPGDPAGRWRGRFRPAPARAPPAAQAGPVRERAAAASGHGLGVTRSDPCPQLPALCWGLQRPYPAVTVPAARPRQAVALRGLVQSRAVTADSQRPRLRPACAASGDLSCPHGAPRSPEPSAMCRGVPPSPASARTPGSRGRAGGPGWRASSHLFGRSLALATGRPRRVSRSGRDGSERFLILHVCR